MCVGACVGSCVGASKWVRACLCVYVSVGERACGCVCGAYVYVSGSLRVCVRVWVRV